MYAVGEAISISVQDLNSKTIHQQSVDFRAFDRFRNFGQALVHDQEKVVVEFFDSKNHLFHPDSVCLKTYHKPEYVYSLVNRKTWYIQTYAVALAICGVEPFTHPDKELVYSKPLQINCQEREIIQSFHAKFKCGGISRYTDLDGVMINGTHSAVMTTFNTVDIAEVSAWHQKCLFAHYYQANSRDAGANTKFWNSFFAPEKKVMLYVGFRSQTMTEVQWQQCRGMNIRCLVRAGNRLRLI